MPKTARRHVLLWLAFALALGASNAAWAAKPVAKPPGPAPAAQAVAAPAAAPVAAPVTPAPAPVVAPPAAATPAEAEPPPPPESDKLAEQGRDAYRAAQYAEAYKFFEKAFALEQKPKFLYNMARAKEKVASYAEAQTLLARYLELYRKQNAGTDPPDAADVTRLIRELKQRAFEALPEVVIESTPPGAQVIGKDGVTLGSTPLTTHMEAGTYKLRLKLAEHTDLDTDLIVHEIGNVHLVLSLKSKQKHAGLSFWCNVRGAQIAVDGKVVAVTPYSGVIETTPGHHQILLGRIGYKSSEQDVMIPEDKVVHSRVVLAPTSGHSGWRSYLGWPLMILGVGAIGGGYGASYMADKEFAGSPNFLAWQKWQNYGYYSGGTAIGLGLALVIWDAVRDDIPDEERVDGPSQKPGNEIRELGPREAAP